MINTIHVPEWDSSAPLTKALWTFLNKVQLPVDDVTTSITAFSLNPPLLFPSGTPYHTERLIDTKRTSMLVRFLML